MSITLINTLAQPLRTAAKFINQNEQPSGLSTSRFIQDTGTCLVPKAVFARSKADLAENTFLELSESALVYFVPALIAVAVGALVLGFRAFGHGVFLFVWMCAAFGGKENKHGGGEFSAATKFAGCGVSLPLPPRRLG